jgi:hypothetical protein
MKPLRRIVLSLPCLLGLAMSAGCQGGVLPNAAPADDQPEDLIPQGIGTSPVAPDVDGGAADAAAK